MDPTAKTNILGAFGLNDLPSETQDEMIGKIGSVIFQAVLVRAVQTMDEKEQEHLQSRIEDAGDDTETLMRVLRDTIPHFSELVQEETARLADESRRVLGAQ